MTITVEDATREGVCMCDYSLSHGSQPSRFHGLMEEMQFLDDLQVLRGSWDLNSFALAASDKAALVGRGFLSPLRHQRRTGSGVRVQPTAFSGARY